MGSDERELSFWSFFVMIEDGRGPVRRLRNRQHTRLAQFGPRDRLADRQLGKLRAEGLGANSQIMANSSYLMDVLGPRLTGSPGVKKSGDWVIDKLKSYGLTNVALEPWPTDPTGTNNGFPHSRHRLSKRCASCRRWQAAHSRCVTFID